VTQTSSQLAIQAVDTMISGRGLFCERDDRVLFEQLDFDWHAGQIIRIAGPNGAGKSSLIRILLGMSASYDGELFYKGQSMALAKYDFRSDLLYLGHQVGIKSSLTPEENLNWLCPGASRTEIYTALANVGLKGFEDVLASGLSAGQQRRVALARLYLEQKPIWILDEPFTAIDKQGVDQLEMRIIEHSRQGGLVVLTTHHQMSVAVTELLLGAHDQGAHS